MHQPSRGDSSSSDRSRSHRREGRRWDNEEVQDGYKYNVQRDRSRSGERNRYIDDKRIQDGKITSIPDRYSKNPSNWSDSSSDEESYSRSTARRDDKYPSYSHESNVPQRDYLRESGNSEFSMLTGESVFQNQIPLKLGGTSVTTEEPPTASSKFSMQMKTPSAGGISIKLGAAPKPKPTAALPSTLVPKSTKVAAVFNADDDDEPEEMPAECKMRMKNVGRETPTSAGPNSFGKTKIGFCNITHITEKKYEKETANKK